MEREDFVCFINGCFNWKFLLVGRYLFLFLRLEKGIKIKILFLLRGENFRYLIRMGKVKM